MCGKSSVKLLSGFCLMLILSACGGGGSDGVTVDAISATPSLGQVQGATVNIYQADGSTLLGNSNLAVDGSAKIEFSADYTGPLILELVGSASSSYFDEAAGSELPTGTGPLLHALVPAGKTSSAISPLTEVAYQIAIMQSVTLSDTIINEINELVRLALAPQLTDLLSTPLLFNAATTSNDLGDDEAGRYALLLAAMAQLGASDATPALTVATQLASDLADGTLDGQSGTTAISGLLYTPASFAADLTAELTSMAGSFGNAALQTAVTSFSAAQGSIDLSNLGSGAGGGNTSACGDSTSADSFFASNAGDITVYVSGGSGGMMTFYDGAASYQLTLVAAGSFGGPGYRVVNDNNNSLGVVFDAASHQFYDETNEVNVIHNDGVFPQGVLQCEKATGNWTVVLSDLSVPPSSVTLSSVQPNTGGGGSSPAGQMGGAVQNGDLALNGDVTTLAGTAGSEGVSDGTGAAASFWYPSGITSDGSSLFLMSKESPVDIFNPNTFFIRKIDIATGEVTTVPGSYTPLAGFLTTDGTSLFRAVGSGVYQINPSTGTVSTLATIGNASFKGITTDGTYLYLSASNGSNNLIYRVEIATGTDTVFVDDDSFGSLNGITTDGSSLYVADMSNNVIHKIDVAAATTSVFAWDAKLLNVEALTSDGVNLYFSKPSVSPAIGKVDIATATVEWLVGYQTGQGSADGDVMTAQFFSPTSFTTDGSSLFVTDGGNNHTIRKID